MVYIVMTIEIFEKCASQCTDEYWANLFLECSKGNFPKGVGVNKANDSVFFKNKNTPVWYNLTNADITNVLDELKAMFINICGLRSQTDSHIFESKVNEFKVDLLKLLDSEWDDIKKKTYKDSIIRSYVLSQKFPGSIYYKKLYNLIKICILFSWVKSENIEYNNKHILNINNITFDPDTYNFGVNVDTDTLVKRIYIPEKISLKNLCKKNIGDR